jgi:hypothetical protein
MLTIDCIKGVKCKEPITVSKTNKILTKVQTELALKKCDFKNNNNDLHSEINWRIFLFLEGGVYYDIEHCHVLSYFFYQTFNLTLVKNTYKLQKLLMNH